MNSVINRLVAWSLKPGSGQTGSLDVKQVDAGELPGIDEGESPLAALEQKELAGVLSRLLRELKPPLGELLADFFSAI